MDKILVHGGQSLSGSIRVSGSKNSALPILAACLLTKEPCVIRHVPDLSDVHYMLQILSHMGAEVERASGMVTVRAENIKTVAPYDIVRKMRASVCVLGPLLGREVQHDPLLALDGGAAGTETIERLIEKARAHLKPGGLLVLEIGHDQSGHLAGVLARQNYRDIRPVADYQGIIRFLFAIYG